MGDCTLTNYANGSVRFFFTDPQLALDDPEYLGTNGEILHEKRAAYKTERYRKIFAGIPPHKVTIPDEFMGRVNVQDKIDSNGGIASKVFNGFAPEPLSLWQHLVQWWQEYKGI